MAQRLAVAEAYKHRRTRDYSLQIWRKRTEMAYGNYALAERRKKPRSVTNLYRHCKIHGIPMGIKSKRGSPRPIRFAPYS